MCTYRTDEDGRSRIPMKRRIEGLERDNAILNDLLSQIRGADDTEVQQVVSLIRSNAPLIEVNATLQRLLHSARSSQRQVDPMINDIYRTTGRALSRGTDLASSTEPASRVLSVDRLIDEPIYQVPATPWTIATGDNHLVSHLVSLWATWYHLLPDGIVLEPFLRAMQNARLDSLFCSPFLVNCILAAGCLFSDYDEAKAVRGRASDLMRTFVKEAEWHFRRDQSTPSITNVQGLGILYVVISQLNQDRDGYHFAIQAAAMSVELLRARGSILATTRSREDYNEAAFVLDTACWGIYSMTTGSMSAWMRPQLVTPPHVPWPVADNAEQNFHETRWSPYPHRGETRDIHLVESLRHHYTLAVLTAELTHTIYAEPGARGLPARSEALHDIHIRLIFWYARLPEHMKHAVPGCPSVAMLLMWYHGIVATLLSAKIDSHRPTKNNEEEQEDMYNADDDDDFDDDDADKDTEDDSSDDDDEAEMHARERTSSDINLLVASRTDEEHLVQHATRIADVLSANQDTYEYSRLHCFMCQPCRLALYVLMERNADHRYDVHITELLTAMRAMSRRFPFSFTLLRMIQLDLRLRKLELPGSAEKLFGEFEQPNSAAWRQRGSSNSVYPSPQVFVGPYAGETQGSRGATAPTNMIEFLNVFDQLAIGS